MPILEGNTVGNFAGVGAEAASPMHTSKYARSFTQLGQKGGVYKLGATGNLAAGLAANSELFQFRYVPQTNNIALISTVRVSLGSAAAAGTAVHGSLVLAFCKQWTVIGSGGTRLVMTGNNCKLRTSFPNSEVNDAGIITSGGLVGGTKTTDTIGAYSFAFGTGANTVSLRRQLISNILLLNEISEGSFPLVLGSQEGFIIRTGNVNWPTGPSLILGVEVYWSEFSNY